MVIIAASLTAVLPPLAPDAGVTPTGTTAVDTATLAQLALQHDRARALYEVIAARASGHERTDALARSAAQRERVAALLALPGVDDVTEPAYDVPAASVATRAARTQAALDTERSIAETYAALLVSSSAADRSWLSNAAFDAYQGAVAHGLTAADVPALPGAVEPSAAP